MTDLREKIANIIWLEIRQIECSNQVAYEKADEIIKLCNIETLLSEKSALSGVLDELLFLKVLKNKSGKTPEYLERQPKAWAAAMQVLDTLEA